MCGSLYCLRVVFASNELSWHLTPGMSRALQRVGSMPLILIEAPSPAYPLVCYSGRW
jgi:hypothetical protein